MSNKLINTTEARKILQVSRKKMSALLAEGTIPFKEDPLDKRVKLVYEKDIERLRSVRKLRVGQ
jgi:hypothetical protein